MSKTLHRLFISTEPIDKTSREMAARFLETPELKIENSYRVDPHVLDNLVLESDDDIAEYSLRNYVKEYGFHNIHLVLTSDEWFDMGLRSTLYGQCRVVDGQIISYGRPGSEPYQLLHRYDEEIQKYFTEATLREWHELDHGLRHIFNHRNPSTHAVFYGYRNADSDKNKATRWRRKPYPLEAWHALPWEKLPEQQPKRPLLNKIIELKQTLLNLLLGKKRLLPLVERKAEMIKKEMELLGHPVRIVEGYRSKERQAELYAQGRTTPGKIVTNAKPGESYHNFGVAVDFVFRKEGYNASDNLWKTLGTIGEKLGFEWGGRWSSFEDRPHFSLSLGYSLKDFQEGKVDYKKFK